MIAHVAEAGEDRGRVLLVLKSAGRASTSCVEAAARLAQSHAAELEGLFVEDDQIAHLVSYPFASEISVDGGTKHPYTKVQFDDDMARAFVRFQRCVNQAALDAKVPVCTNNARGAWFASVNRACQEQGPWNILSLAEPIGPGSAAMLSGLFQHVHAATGILVAGANAAAGDGPILVVVEDIESLPAMTRFAHRVADGDSDMIHILLAAESSERAQWMESEARLFFADQTMGSLEDVVPVYGSSVAFATDVCARNASLVIAQFGGLLVPNDDLEALTRNLRCPLLLTR